MGIEGRLDVHGVVTDAPCRGTLDVHPRARRATLVYDAAFEGPDGTRWSLRGEKHAPLYALPGITRLHTELRRDGERYATGLLQFDVRDLPQWLSTFRFERRDAALRP